VANKSTIILSVGEATHLSFTKLFQLGSLELLISNKIWLKIITKPIGYHKQFSKKDSIIGSKTQKTGVSQETDIGETQFHFGYRKMGNKSFVLVQ
jgi:hypothetical protein